MCTWAWALAATVEARAPAADAAFRALACASSASSAHAFPASVPSTGLAWPPSSEDAQSPVLAIATAVC